MNRKPASIVLPLLWVIVFGCSTQKNNFVNREYHALNTKFNVVFNGKEALSIGKAILYQNLEDDFLNILPVEPILLAGEDQENNASIPSFSIAEEKAVKAIQKHSMNIEGKQRNRQIQEAYLLLGKARYYDRRFLPALEAFNFLLEEYGGQEAFYEGKLWREKTNLRLKNDEFAITNLKPYANQIPFGQKLYAEYNATVAQGYINLKEEDSARVYISRAALAEKKKVTKARYRYIEAQLLERANLIDSAQRAYQSIVNWNRKAPRIFWMQAKLQSIRLRAVIDSVSPLPSLDRLSKRFENQPYLHLIHQQEARYLLSLDQDSLALEYYNKSLKSVYIDPATQRANYRELADYNFSQGNYVKTGSYLDSLVGQIPEEGRLKKTIQREREGLEDVITLEKIIQTTDSILRLTAMSKEEQRNFFQTEIDRKRAQELAAVVQEKKGIFNFGGNASNNFYFYNNRLLVGGKQEFLSTWGNRPNADNWNRLQATQLLNEPIETQAKGQEREEGFFVETADFFIEQVPTDQVLIDSLDLARKQAYLDVGIIYKEKFKNRSLALERLEKVLTLSPTPRQEESALYHCFKLQEKENPKQAEEYKKRLSSSYPDSAFTQILVDPDNFSLAENQTPSSIYAQLYEAYNQQEYERVLEEGENLKVFVSGTSLAPKVALLQANAKGRLFGEEKYKEALEEFLKQYPNAEEATAVKITFSRIQKEAQEQHKRVSVKSYKWVFAFAKEEGINSLVDNMKKAMENDPNSRWKISRDVYDKTTDFIVVHTKNQYPDQQFYLKLWGDIPNFDKKTNNFVLLSAQYEEIQRLKSWQPK